MRKSVFWQRRQRGVAAVLALLLTALAVVLVADLFRAQQVQLRSMQSQRYRLQAKLAQRAALDTLIVALQGPTASTQPIAPGRVWPGLADSEGASPEAAVSQQIVDAQSRFNLTNLALAAVVNPFEIAAFGRMLAALQLDPKLAQQAAEAIARTQAAAGAGSAAATQAGITELDDLLGAPGFTPAVLDRLRAFAVVLPQRTPINVNTAPAIVLMSVADLAPADAQRLVASRQQANFRDVSDFVLRLNDRQTLEGVNFVVASEFFLVTSKVQVQTASLTTQALLWLRSRNPTETVLVSLRER